tara:strand:+ start:4114 stop:5640 length:1527 start_codon:yes stop_codon:yes gene_type:complete
MKKKIIKFSNIEKLSKFLKKKKKKIVHCHGVFDLLHIGHLKHFESAKKYGDILIVSITPNKFVFKELNRPYFDEQERLEALAAVETVDFVVLNNYPDSINIIKKIKPNFYCKGPDYNSLENNKTSTINNNNNFIEEKKICKKIGCQIKLTSDIKYSSSNIINEKLFELSNLEKKFLLNIKKKYPINKIEKKIDHLSKLKFMVIGDPIIDTYLFSDFLGVSSKSSVVSTKLMHEENYLGGSLAVAEMLCKLGCSVDLLAYKSKNKFFSKQLKLLSKRINFLNICNQKKIPRVSRFLHQNRNEKLFQFYEFDKFAHNKESSSKFLKFLKKRKKTHNTIVIDFGFGFLDKNMINILEKNINNFALNVHANSLNSNYNKFTKYKKYNYLSMNKKEFQLGLNTAENNINYLIKDSKENKINYPFAVTLGNEGSVLVEKKKEQFVPSFFHKTIDTVGSGDAFFAITSALNKIKKDNLLNLFLGNVYAGLHALNIGNKKFVTKDELKKSINSILK